MLVIGENPFEPFSAAHWSGSVVLTHYRAFNLLGIASIALFRAAYRLCLAAFSGAFGFALSCQTTQLR
jgi:hypothetical protein